MLLCVLILGVGGFFVAYNIWNSVQKKASFSVNLSIQPIEVRPKETVTITVSVANTGGNKESYTAVLEIDGVKQGEKRVTIAAGDSQSVIFTVSKEDVGSYSVAVNGLSGSFTVVAPVIIAPPAPAAFSVSTLSILPAEVELGGQVTISIVVANTGGTEGSYSAVLKINGVKEADKSVTVATGGSEIVSFSVTGEKVGNYNVVVDGLSGSFTVVAEALSTPRLISPPDGATDIEHRPTFVWKEVANAGGYELVIAHNYDFSDVYWDVSTRLTGYRFTEGLEPSSQYYWMVCAKLNPADPNTPVAYSEIWTFTTAPATTTNSAPYVPSNPSPSNHATDISTFTLSWSGGDPDPGDTVTYDIYFGTSSPPPLLFSHQLGTTVTQPFPMPPPSTKCYWKIIATDSQGASTEGPLWNFTTAEYSIEPPFINVSTATGPSTGKVNQTLTFSTSAETNVAGSLEYRFDWGDGNYSSWSSSPSAFHAWSSPGTYSVKAQARLVTGALPSKWSLSKTVNIAVETFELSTSVSPARSGIISPSSGTYDSGTRVTLTATASTCYRFDQWSNALGTSSTITIIMDSNKSIVANFASIRYNLTTSVSPSGSGSISPSGGNYDAGTKVTLTATPASGYRFVSWSVDASGTTSTITITMDSNKSVVANFKEIPPQRITLDMGGAVYLFSTYEIEFSRYLEAGEEVTGFVEWEKDYTWGWQFNVYDPYRNRIPDASWEGHSRRHPFNFIASCDGDYIIEMVNLGDYISPDGIMEIRPPGWSQTEY